MSYTAGRKGPVSYVRIKRTEYFGLQSELTASKEDNKKLNQIINNPELDNFISAIKTEAAHQIKRWGSEHDKGKSPEDWMWVIAYLSTKATQAHRYKDFDKYKHHIITTAAACLNWHRHAIDELLADTSQKGE